MPDLGYMGLDYMITSVVVTKLCILELYSEPNYKEDPGPEPERRSAFPPIAIIILAIIGVAAAVALCAMPSAPLEAPPALAGEINHTYITDGSQTRTNQQNDYAETPDEQPNQ
ncbi:hypothetical protein PRIPAC_91869 [Pristionchus pacificus]|uniref:Uncharacterized protein n=1 Tax=Pristionchus pacificus TaxID=54126 RepID=A0A2A6BPZ6_PRIPA|nr:hypothetical protein PRIPAC_91869 [Pristionchus pacificus]|eukprot:PDM68022.1 hypothetical protein PRIPAC_46066 [Pristionchus pacificus]